MSARERQRPCNRRGSITFDLEVHGLRFTCTYSCFDGGGVAEVFLQNHKGGSGADIVARDAAVAASLALQFGCPLEVLQHALLRNPNGEAASPLGRAIEAIAQAEGVS